jgi:RNA 3'-phosphate cyclase
VDRVQIDGSQGEGGGQILRTAVAFSVIKQVPVRVDKIRAGRGVPGLKRQHVSALRVVASVFGGTLSGAEEGSMEVDFVPGLQRLSRHEVDMGTAASITLVLQSVIPAVSLGGSELALTLTGGTDVQWSPTFDYFRSVVIPGYRTLGIDAAVSVSRRGYYPKGGGTVTAEIRKSSPMSGLDLTTRGGVTSATVESRCALLPKTVAQRQADAAAETLGRGGIGAEVVVAEELSSSPGTSVTIHSVGAGYFIGSDALGARGKPAEQVGKEAGERFVLTSRTGACMDANLADMLIPLLSLSPATSRVRVPEMTPHLESGLRLAEQFTSCAWSAEKDRGSTLVTVRPRPT